MMYTVCGLLSVPLTLPMDNCEEVLYSKCADSEEPKQCNVTKEEGRKAAYMSSSVWLKSL